MEAGTSNEMKRNLLRGTVRFRMGDHDNTAVDDVRMRGFAHRHTVEAALAWLDAQLPAAG